ncbi:Long-chain-fatty-acid--CoA ligase [BD1-7 clade bacterium]|uniref:Long-chain-fatty-acid--CoA ligase n=1 Tax=BD1-7 clade bacterium TaxID=2029982 RepID=A0A5S9PEC9_9GAMM|nr:Long-chain-fatty-acid--CoA ligase [BD1-7 clade bacterium]CAA0102005.1 Long-chain-fatty-acid--CoA ligase [BD1-7 clade bacterium]
MKNLSEIYAGFNAPENRQHVFGLFEKQQLTYGALAKHVRQLTALFQQHNVSTANRVVICSDNDELVSIAVTAALMNGVTAVVLSPEFTTARRLSLIGHAQASLIIGDESMHADSQDESVPFYAISRETASKSSALLARFKKAEKKGWRESLNQLAEVEPTLTASPDDIAFINFSSGTTGAPKGICISFANLLTHLQTLCDQFGYDSNSKILNNMMLSHADGLIQGPVLALYCGGMVARPCPMDVQYLEEYLNAVYRLRITHLITVPTILSFIDRLSAHDDYFESDDFKHLITVAGLMERGLWQRLEQRFNQRINNIYGLTETVAGGIFCGPEDQNYQLGTIGKPTDMDIRIVDPNGQDVSPGEEGELWLAGENVFTGYWNDEEKTADVFDGKWFKTGDLAVINAEGFVQISGRIKELIISGGFNVHPAEVNEALRKHPSVADVATVGMPDEQWQEIVVSAVVLDANTDLDEKALIAFCRQHIEERKVPKRIALFDTLPKGDAGKVKIEALKSRLTDSDIASGQQFSQARLFELAADTFKQDAAALSLSDRAGVLPGWDSLGHLNLMLAVEKAVGVTLSAQDIMATESLNDLWDLVSRKVA